MNHLDEFLREMGLSAEGWVENEPSVGLKGRHGLYDKIEESIPGLYEFLQKTFPNFKKNRDEYKSKKRENKNARKKHQQKIDQKTAEEMEAQTREKLKSGNIKMKPEKEPAKY